MLSAMDRPPKSVLSRALELAATGEFEGIAALKARLIAEGFRSERPFFTWAQRDLLRKRCQDAWRTRRIMNRRSTDAEGA